MLVLTQEHHNFFKQHNIPIREVFDGTGLTITECRAPMEALDKHWVTGVPCSKEGHTLLQTRSGKCIVCYPASREFYRRHYTDGYAYIAVSTVGKVFKVGFTENLTNRQNTLNRDYYGELNDWKIIWSTRSKQAGKIEAKIHSFLANYSAQREYYQAGRYKTSYEIFQCNFEDIKKAISRIKQLNPTLEFTSEVEIPQAIAYKFKQ